MRVICWQFLVKGFGHEHVVQRQFDPHCTNRMGYGTLPDNLPWYVKPRYQDDDRKNPDGNRCDCPVIHDQRVRLCLSSGYKQWMQSGIVSHKFLAYVGDDYSALTPTPLLRHKDGGQVRGEGHLSFP